MELRLQALLFQFIDSIQTTGGVASCQVNVPIVLLAEGFDDGKADTLVSTSYLNNSICQLRSKSVLCAAALLYFCVQNETGIIGYWSEKKNKNKNYKLGFVATSYVSPSSSFSFQHLIIHIFQIKCRKYNEMQLRRTDHMSIFWKKIISDGNAKIFLLLHLESFAQLHTTATRVIPCNTVVTLISCFSLRLSIYTIFSVTMIEHNRAIG